MLRKPSSLDLSTTANSVEATHKVMKADIAELVASCDEDNREDFKREMNDFVELFGRWKEGSQQKLIWEDVRTPSEDVVIPYDMVENTCTNAEKSRLASKLSVCKLNGGLGTTMGCIGPKSTIEVRKELTFLDITMQQLEFINIEHDTQIPLVLMNSFNTDEDTKKIVRKYGRFRTPVETFNQSRFPRFDKDTHVPIPKSFDDEKSAWYPPGHGDIFTSIARSGLLDKLLDEGREYLFVANVDNLGASIDFDIVKYIDEHSVDFMMEVTNKTRADVKGGTLIEYQDTVKLLEIAQVSSQNIEEFKSITKFKIFNTNNVWINLRSLKHKLEQGALPLDIITNNKQLANGTHVVQLETAIGASVQCFQNSLGINVPRTRFLPVKSTSDLFNVQSNIYHLDQGILKRNPLRAYPELPLVKLGADFAKVTDYLQRFMGVPNILELDHLTVVGDVTFGKNVTLKGTVLIIANKGDHIDIPSGAILENKVVTGNLRIINH
eukprot:TRINITY_DN41449_c0_g1_i1.p1 TRINITY_DN41449_c0_g1~~TRINITY_DN41449_c0_g1_i1.p1  ORF type:complete len:494 (-),score=151.92 TRINITY_DN41449_c0_g1_i1:65-1546(-)